MTASHQLGPPRWLRKRLPFTSRIVEVDGHPMHVMERGVGQTVVMLHGNPTWGYLWRKVADLLPPDKYRVVLPDLMGLGYSDHQIPSRQHTLINHIQWMSGLFSRLELEGAVFVGQDWGGPIGLGALAHSGVAAKGIVLANTAVGPPRPGFKPSLFHRFAKWPGISTAVFRGLAFPQAMLGMTQGDRRKLWFDPAYMAPLADIRTNGAPLAMARMVPDGDQHPSVSSLQEVQAFLTAFAGPIELVWGTKDPILGRVINHLERLLPDARVTRTSGGHFLPEEEPGPIAEAIIRVARAH